MTTPTPDPAPEPGPPGTRDWSARSSLTQAREAKRLAPAFAGACLLAAMLFVTGFSWPSLGGAYVVPLLAIWLVLVVLALRAFVRRPRLTLLLAVLDFVVWVVAVLIR